MVENQASDRLIFGALPYLCAVAIRQLAIDESSTYSVPLDALENNAHCVAVAIDALIRTTVSQACPNEPDVVSGSLKAFLHVHNVIVSSIKCNGRLHLRY